jgi:hypothetical protein
VCVPASPIFVLSQESAVRELRGLVVFRQIHGFSSNALTTFGHSQRLICIGSLDLYQTPQEVRGLQVVLAAKMRRAGADVRPFVRYRDLFQALRTTAGESPSCGGLANRVSANECTDRVPEIMWERGSNRGRLVSCKEGRFCRAGGVQAFIVRGCEEVRRNLRHQGMS